MGDVSRTGRVKAFSFSKIYFLISDWWNICAARSLGMVAFDGWWAARPRLTKSQGLRGRHLALPPYFFRVYLFISVFCLHEGSC